RSSGGSITAPGQLASHYAPRATLRLNAKTARPGEVFLGFGPGVFDENLSQAGDLPEAAARLFAMLRALDENGAQAIAVSPIPDHGLGRAINDRLRRAAASRP
ncbi:MAG: Sua5 family C-terminal domain-containing protein, partial [Pseudomonadota bacterium]